MRARVLAVCLILLAPALAGCLSDVLEERYGTSLVPAPPIPLDQVVQQAHDHGDANLHTFAWNLEGVGYHTGYSDEERDAQGSDFSGGGFTELAVHRPWVFMCRGGQRPGIVVLDVSTPNEPTFVSYFRMPRCDDIEVNHDATWVFASAQRNQPGELAEESDGPANLPRGTWVIDASNKESLQFESFYAMPYNGPHTITYHQYEDGPQIVIHNLYDLYGRTDPTGQLPLPAPEGANPATQRVEISELTRGPDGTTQLERIGVYSATETAARNNERTIIPHDATVYTNPLDEKAYMLVAYWDAGVHIVNLQDPSDPRLVGTFNDFAPSEYRNIHLVRAFEDPIDDRWILVAEPEIIQAEESGQITFIDASDPTQPEKLGHWTLPGEVTIPEPFLFSPHNFDLDDAGRIYLAHQHAGIWVIDVDGVGTPEAPETVGAILPTAPNDEVDGGPGTWGVFLEDGLLFASDTPTGLHVLEYTGP